MFVGIGDFYVDSAEVCAIYPPAPGVKGLSTVLLKNGHKFDVDLNARETAKLMAEARRILAAVNAGYMIHPEDFIRTVEVAGG